MSDHFKGYDCKGGKHKVDLGHGDSVKMCDTCYKRYMAGPGDAPVPPKPAPIVWERTWRQEDTERPYIKGTINGHYTFCIVHHKKCPGIAKYQLLIEFHAGEHYSYWYHDVKLAKIAAKEEQVKRIDRYSGWLKALTKASNTP